MLKLRNMIEDDTIAAGLLNNYNFEELDFGFCRSSSNVVYWVKGDGKLFFLRYTTEDERTPESILAELNYINYLRQHGIYANRPTYSLSYPPENEPEWMKEVVEKLQRARRRIRRKLCELSQANELTQIE